MKPWKSTERFEATRAKLIERWLAALIDVHRRLQPPEPYRWPGTTAFDIMRIYMAQFKLFGGSEGGSTSSAAGKKNEPMRFEVWLRDLLARSWRASAALVLRLVILFLGNIASAAQRWGWQTREVLRCGRHRGPGGRRISC
jgi:hypothetical protein